MTLSKLTSWMNGLIGRHWVSVMTLDGRSLNCVRVFCSWMNVKQSSILHINVYLHCFRRTLYQLSVADFGMVLTSTTVGSAAECSEVTAVDATMPAATSGGAEHALGGAQQRLSPTMTVSSSAPDATRQRQSMPNVPTSVAIKPFADRMTIAGVDISRNSSIAVLKAACHFLEVSQSGSKAKLWDRLVSAVDRAKILGGKQLADAALLEGSRAANPVQTVEKPADEEVQFHILTHIPYAAWCEACVKSKGKPERHERNEGRICDREIPTLSFDFAFIGKSAEDGDEGEGDESAKLTTLVVHDSHIVADLKIEY